MRCFILLAAFAVAAVVAIPDYYELLEVTRDSPDRDIKMSFRKKSMKVHPDKMDTEDEKELARAKIMYDRLAVAQDVLIDKEKRWRYEKMLGFGHKDYDELTWKKVKDTMESEWADKGKFKHSFRQSEEYLEYESKWETICLWAGLAGLVVVMLPILWFSGSKKKGKTAEQKRADRAKLIASEKKKLEAVSQKMSAGYDGKDKSSRKRGEVRQRKE